MGHIRIGTLPATKRWKEVVGLITEGAEVSKVAESTVHASELAFNKVHDDFGFREAVWLMTQFGVAGSKENPAQHLDSLGIEVSGASSVVEVALAVAKELDRRVDASRRRSDFGEMAQRALISSVTEHLQEKAQGQLPSMGADVKAALGKLGKKKEFGQFSRSFFAKLTNQCLEYFLSKNLATHVGEKRRFATTEQLAKFEAALTKHCEEASAIVEDFSGDWFSKNRFEGGGEISREKAEGFGWYALEKMRRELAARAKSDA
jgi:hypothetical protein